LYEDNSSAWGQFGRVVRHQLQVFLCKSLLKKTKVFDVFVLIALRKMEPDEHNNDKERIGILLQQIADQQLAYNTLYDRNVKLYEELMQAKNIIAAVQQTLQLYSSSQ
jgi:hypothetical protein